MIFNNYIICNKILKARFYDRREVIIIPVGNDKYYKPDEALHELMIQENIMSVAVDVQALLRIMVDKSIINREEISAYREEVRNSPKYKPVLDAIKREKDGFAAAKTESRRISESNI